MAKTYRLLVPLLLVWLIGWMALSWPAIQDDALIHLRYADHLLRYHFITYDGVHADYGASSLLYVALLAALRVSPPRQTLRAECRARRICCCSPDWPWASGGAGEIGVRRRAWRL